MSTRTLRSSAPASSASPAAASAGSSASRRARGQRDGRAPLDIEQALLVEFRDGLWADVRAQPLDEQAFDAFWA